MNRNKNRILDTVIISNTTCPVFYLYCFKKKTEFSLKMTHWAHKYYPSLSTYSFHHAIQPVLLLLFTFWASVHETRATALESLYHQTKIKTCGSKTSECHYDDKIEQIRIEK